MCITIALILDPVFGEKIAPLAEVMPVWVVESAINNEAVDILRPKFQNGHITKFLVMVDEKPSDTMRRVLYAIEEHHGVASQVEPYDTLEVYGCNSKLFLAFSDELGFRFIFPTEFGFRAEK